MSAVHIPEEFIVWVCYVTLALTTLADKRTVLHPYIHDASGQRDGAKQIAADSLPVFQRKDTDRICVRVYAVFE